MSNGNRRKIAAKKMYLENSHIGKNKKPGIQNPVNVSIPEIYLPLMMNDVWKIQTKLLMFILYTYGQNVYNRSIH